MDKDSIFCLIWNSPIYREGYTLDQKTVTITYNPAKTNEATLQKAIEKLGYSAEKVTIFAFNELER